MRKILIIDDAAFYRLQTKTLLERQGFNVLEADNGETGLEIFREEKPDLVILDNILPGIQGIGVLKIIREHSPDAKVIVVSSAANEAMIERIEELRANAFIKKPHEDIVFLDNVFRVLEE